MRRRHAKMSAASLAPTTASACNQAQRYYSPVDHTLHICQATLQSWAAQDALLAQVHDAFGRGDHQAVLRASELFWRTSETGRRGHLAFHRAVTEPSMLAGGAVVTRAPGTQPGVNCALYALGEYMGFTSAQSDGGSGGHAGIPSVEHINAAETLLKVLSGDELNVGTYLPHLPFWADVLLSLGFTAVEEPQSGDRVVYTIRPPDDAPDKAELAVHYGVVRSIGVRGISALCRTSPT